MAENDSSNDTVLKTNNFADELDKYPHIIEYIKNLKVQLKNQQNVIKNLENQLQNEVSLL